MATLSCALFVQILKRSANTQDRGIKFQIEHVEEAEPPADAIWPPVTEDDDRALTEDAVP